LKVRKQTVNRGERLPKEGGRGRGQKGAVPGIQGVVDKKRPSEGAIGRGRKKVGTPQHGGLPTNRGFSPVLVVAGGGGGGG